MGSGKTTIGKIVAKHLKVKFLDLDDYIEKSEGSTIESIFSEMGELYFRKKEFHYLNELLTSNQDFLLSTGGGTPCYGANMEAILAASPNVFYIKVSISELVARLSTQKESRPLIKDVGIEKLPEFIGKHLFERSFYYNMAVNKVSGDMKSAEQIANEIQERLI